MQTQYMMTNTPAASNGKLVEPSGPYRLPELERRLDEIGEEIGTLAATAEDLVTELHEAVALVGVRVERNRARERRRNRRYRSGHSTNDNGRATA